MATFADHKRASIGNNGFTVDRWVMIHKFRKRAEHVKQGNAVDKHEQYITVTPHSYHQILFEITKNMSSKFLCNAVNYTLFT